MRYMTLNELLDELRAEAGLSQNVAHGVTLVDPHKALLRRVQEELWLTYDWPHLSTVQNVTVPAGQRYTAYPDRVAFEGIKDVWARDDQQTDWRKLGYGIGLDHLNDVDSDDGETQSPVRRWQHYISPAGEAINDNMFEVWPVPERDTTVRFAAKRKLFPLTDNTHKTTIDGPLIALQAAAEILARQKAEDAALKLQRAADRRKLLGLRQSAPDTRRANRASVGSARSNLRPGIDYIES